VGCLNSLPYSMWADVRASLTAPMLRFGRLQVRENRDDVCVVSTHHVILFWQRGHRRETGSRCGLLLKEAFSGAGCISVNAAISV